MTRRGALLRSSRQRWNDLGVFTRRVLRWGALLLAMALVVGAGVWAWNDLLLNDPDLTCDEDEEITKHGPDDECVGVTDGSYVFAPYLNDIFRLIKAENDEVVAEAEREDGAVPYVTVAFVLPFTSADPIDREEIRRETKGAYLAQYGANREPDRPNIRLVLGNVGDANAQWRPVVDRLAEMGRSEEDRLRAVTGFEVSTRNTEEAIRALTNEARLPVVLGPLTADDIENGPDNEFPGLARVLANNSDQAAALASHYDDVEPERTLLVEDLREGDNYVATLREVFGSVTRDATHRPEQFRSGSDMNDERNFPNEARQMVDSICTMDGVDTIYFAGRDVHFRIFVNALIDRGCQDQTYTVLTVHGSSTLFTDPELDWEGLAEGEVTVRYTTNAHPDAWITGDPPDTGGSAEDFEELLDRRNEVARQAGLATGEDFVDLTDSVAITMYDTVWTAITGIRSAVTPESAIPSPDEVASSWARMHGGSGNFVHGASGWICLDAYGRPYNKAVSIVELDPATRSISFEGLAWPAGGPPDEDCQLPNTPTE
ncbi:hypothetical protein [Streptomyces sp. B6B3]|uniref:hypothetical protein n=1 Tax=Streptomyces sp. B6B3 TaxID=3153570 RepID=UPI00325CEB7A